MRISRQGPFSTTERPVWQRQTEQGGVCRWLRRHAYHHRQACACRCHTAARIFSQTLARRVCQDFRAAFPCGRRPPGVAASKLVLSEAERIRRTWGWIASQRPFRTDAPLPFAIPKAPLHYALRLPPTCHDIFTHTRSDRRQGRRLRYGAGDSPLTHLTFRFPGNIVFLILLPVLPPK